MKFFKGLLYCLLLVIAFNLDLYSASNDDANTKRLSSLQELKNGFIANKGQVMDQKGKFRSDILYTYDNNGIKVILKENSFSYEFYSYEVNKTNSLIANITPKYLPKVLDYNLKLHRVDVQFKSSTETTVEAQGESDAFFNFITPANSANGITNVHVYKKVIYKNIYQNIDLAFYISEKNEVKYDFIIHPGGNPSNIKMKYSGADDVALTSDGKISISTSQGNLFEQIPISYTYDKKNPSILKSVNVKYSLNNNIVSFNVPKNNSESTLVIDPEIVWGTYYGGAGIDEFYDLVKDKNGNLIACGTTRSATNIATGGAFQNALSGTSDALLVKFTDGGNVLWGTYFGYAGNEAAYGVTIDSHNDIYITGNTSSNTLLPTTGAQQTVFGGGVDDIFVAKFNSDGQRIWATYYGGNNLTNSDCGYDIAADSVDNIYVCGLTASVDKIATSGAHQQSKSGNYDSFLAKFDTDGMRDWCTYYGGNGPEDYAFGVAIDKYYYVYVCGLTSSTNSNAITTLNAHQTTYGGGEYDGYIAKFDSAGTRIWATYYGDTGHERMDKVALDSLNYPYVIGYTNSTANISTPTSQQPAIGGSFDAFIVKFNREGIRQWATYYGGPGDEYAKDIVVDPKTNNLFFLTNTSSTSNISTPDAFQSTLGGGRDAVIAKFTSAGTRIWGTYLGGSGDEMMDWGGIAIDFYANPTIAGNTSSSSAISTPGAYQTNRAGLFDGFVAKMGSSLLVGNISTPMCAGETINVPYHASKDFSAGNTFTAQLSNSNGAFTVPTAIGTRNDTKSGIIQAVIPKNTPSGTKYRIRITSSAPVKTSIDNGVDLTINSLPIPIIYGEFPACSNTPTTYSSTFTVGIQSNWVVTGGSISGASNKDSVKVIWKADTVNGIKLIRTILATGCKDSIERSVTVNTSPLPNILGKNVVKALAEEKYNTKAVSAKTNLWRAKGGTITSDSTAANVMVKWGAPGIGYLTIIQTDTKNGCIGTESMTITIQPASSKIAVYGDTNVCQKTINTYIAFADSLTKTYWKVISGGEIIGDSSSSTVDVHWIEAGTQKLKLFQSKPSIAWKDSVIQDIVVNPSPFVGISGSRDVCLMQVTPYQALFTENIASKWEITGGTFQSQSTGNNVEVVWDDSNQDPSRKFYVGTLKLTQTNNTSGCKDSLVMNIRIFGKPNAKITGSKTGCTNNTMVYTSPRVEGFTNFWYVTGGAIVDSTSDTTINIKWGTPGNGTIKLKKIISVHCGDSLNYQVTIKQSPDKPIISRQGADLVSSATTGNQWFFKNKKIPFATDPTFSPVEAGYYSVQVSDNNTCLSEMSDQYNYDPNGVDDIVFIANGINVYPNPTDDVLNIQFNTNIEESISYSLTNTVGAIIINEDFTLDGREIKTLNIANLPVGVYMLQVRKGNHVYWKKIIKY